MKYRGVVCLTIFIFFTMALSCGLSEQGRDSADIRTGKALSKTYCATCHLYPAPDLLDKQTWKTGVLPVMANFVKLQYLHDSLVPKPPEFVERDSSVLPPAVHIPINDFRKIQKFYLTMAPDSLTSPERKLPIRRSLHLFSIEIPEDSGAPSTTAVSIDAKNHLVYQADALQRNVNIFDKDLHRISSIKTINIGTSFRKSGDTLLVTNIGEYQPNPGHPTGNVMRVVEGPDHKFSAPAVVLDSLDRSIESIPADIDGDGREDLVVCEFGFLRGGFAWYRNMGDGKYVKQLIKQVPGAERAYVQDENHDGRPDIWVLFAQGREGISLFINQGNGLFTEHSLLSFPPAYGSSYFELADINHDGKQDIIYTCGDNNDYSRVLKPYHGVYIFINEGHHIFKQQYFFPIHGCYKAVARDFEGNGRMDLACISYYADYVHDPEESFVYLKNLGGMKFRPYTIKDLPKGRWLCMDVDDLDGNGKLDIVLGNYAAPYNNLPNWQNEWEKAPPFIVLKHL